MEAQKNYASLLTQIHVILNNELKLKFTNFTSKITWESNFIFTKIIWRVS